MKIRRVVLRSLLFCALLLTLLYAYIQIGFLPGRLKSFVIQKTEQLTGEKVVFDKALYLPFRGLSFFNFKIVDTLDGSVLFSAKTVALDVRVFTFLKEKKLVVRNVFLEAPFYDWSLKNNRRRRTETVVPPPKTKISGQINVPFIPENDEPKLEDLGGGPDIFLPENVYLEQFEIVNGRVIVRESPQSPVAEEITHIDLKMAFRKPPIIHFTGSFDLGQKTYAQFQILGAWDLNKANYDFNLRSQSRNIPAWLLRYQQNHPLILKKGLLDLQIHLANAPSTEKRALFHAKAALSQASLSAGQTNISGGMNLNSLGEFDFEHRKISRYEGSLELDSVNLANLSKEVPLVEDLNGVLTFKPDSLKTESISGVCQKLIFNARGSFSHFSEPVFEATFRTKSIIGDLLSAVPQNLTRALMKDWDLEGFCETVTSAKGSFKEPAAIRWSSFLKVRDCTLKNIVKKIDLTEISSDLSVNPEGVRFKNTRLTAFKKNYFLEGTLPALAGQSAYISIRSQDLGLMASYTRNKDLFEIQNAKFSYPGIRGEFHGKSLGFEKPFLDFKGNFEADLERMVFLAAPKAPALKNSGLKGSLAARFILKGVWDDPLNWDLELDGKSETLWVKKMRLDDFETQIRMKNKKLNIPYLHARPYRGSGGFRSSFDLAKPDIPFDGKLYFNDLDLELLSKDLDLKQKDLAGKATFTATLRGHLKSKDSFSGYGRVNIHEGQLWKTDLFKDMGRLPLVTVIGLDEVNFRDLNADFTIHRKKISTQNLTLDSDTVHLLFKGSVGFDQSLDLVMWVRYSNDVMRGAFDTGGIVPFVVEKAQAMISQYRVTGTFKEPKNEKILTPLP